MTQERAKRLVELMLYEAGGCLIVGSVRPDIAPMSEEERRYLWDRTTHNLFSTVCEISNGRTPATVRCVNDIDDGMRHGVGPLCSLCRQCAAQDAEENAALHPKP